MLISVISNVSKLLSNLSRESLQVILASPAFISFQSIKFNAVGIEVAEYYVNFLKILSQKVDANSVHLIFNHVRASLCRNTHALLLAGRLSASTIIPRL